MNIPGWGEVEIDKTMDYGFTHSCAVEKDGRRFGAMWHKSEGDDVRFIKSLLDEGDAKGLDKASIVSPAAQELRERRQAYRDANPDE